MRHTRCDALPMNPPYVAVANLYDLTDRTQPATRKRPAVPSGQRAALAPRRPEDYSTFGV